MNSRWCVTWLYVLILASLFLVCFLSVTAISVCLHAVGRSDKQTSTTTNRNKNNNNNNNDNVPIDQRTNYNEPCTNMASAFVYTNAINVLGPYVGHATMRPIATTGGVGGTLMPTVWHWQRLVDVKPPEKSWHFQCNENMAQFNNRVHSVGNLCDDKPSHLPLMHPFRNRHIHTWSIFANYAKKKLF